MPAFETVDVFKGTVILDHGRIQHRGRSEMLTNSTSGNTSDPGMPVVGRAVEVAAMDHHGVMSVFIPIMLVAMVLGTPGDHDGASPPAAVGVVGFMGRKGYPPQMGAGMNPRHAAWVPTQTDSEQGTMGADGDPRHRRGPIPQSCRKNPVAIVMGHITERFAGNPNMVSMPYHPGSRCKWGPSGMHMKRTPEIVVRIFIINFFPYTVTVQGVGLTM